MRQRWVGSTDVNHLLTQIGGWGVGCYNQGQAEKAVNFAVEMGWVGIRVHHAPAYPPHGVLCFEVTDRGLSYLRGLGEDVYAKALKMRQWYRDRVVPESGIEPLADGAYETPALPTELHRDEYEGAVP